MNTVNVNGNQRSQSLGLRLNDRKVFREYIDQLPKVGSHYLLPLEANRIALLSEEQFEYLKPPAAVNPKKIFNATKNKQWNDEVSGRVTLLTLNEQALVLDRMITHLPSPKEIFDNVTRANKPIFRELSIINSAKDRITDSAANFMANQAIQRMDDPEVSPSSTEDTGGDIDPDELGFNLNQLMRSNSSVVPNLNTSGQVGIQENIVPQELQDYLDRFVIGNIHAKKVLSIAAHYHALRAVLNTNSSSSKKNQIQKSNVLMIGPTGSGKTLILSTLARKMEVPFVTVDATTYTQVGYHGNDPSKMIQELFNAAEGDVEATKYGIIFIDEGDKLASRGSSQQSSSKRALQQSMLKIVEGTEVEVNSSSGKVSIDTSNILFIIGGAFVGLEDIIREREDAEDAALTEPLVRTGDLFARATEDDYEEFGLIPEFIGRFHQKTYLEKPSLDVFKSILTKSENSVLKQFQRLFNFDGNVLEITDDAIDSIAEEAMARVTGARALRTILNEILFDAIFELNGRGGQILTIDVTEEDEYKVDSIPNPDVDAVKDMKMLSEEIIYGDYYLDRIRERPMKPKDINDALSLEVIGNNHAKKTLASAVYAHQRRIVYNHFAKNAEDQPEIEKSNVLLLGPTGSGKTLILNTLAKFLCVPFVSVDATTFSEAGYIGSDPEDMVNQLYIQSGYSTEETERGIIYIDEIDKLAMGLEGNRSEHQRATQQAFLKLIEGTEVNVGGYSSSKVDTSNILFICGGAFVGLEKLLEMDGLEIDEHSPFEEVLSDDIANFGLIPEFVGRLPALTHLQSPTEDTYKLILMKPKNSLFKQYKRLLKENQHNLSITDAAIDIIAQRAHRLATGARALRAVMEEILAGEMFELPGMNPQDIVIDSDSAGGIEIKLSDATDIEEPEVFELQVSSRDSKLESLQEHIPTPSEIKAELDKNVIGNEETKRVLATAVNSHYTRTLHRLKDNDEPVIEKTNLLLLGPTGSGKTHVLKTLEQDLKVPMVIVSATDFTPVSYRGRDPEQAVVDLLSHCRDVEQCERGIIFIDEFDKLALGTGDPNRDEHNRAIQQGFLKLIEGTTVSAGRYTVDTSNILFICGGAFVGMEKILTDRGVVIDKGKPFDAVDAVDIVSYKLIPEITGRIPTIIDLEAPNLNTFKMMLLKTENSLLKQKKKELSVYGHELFFHESSVDRLAQLATERPTGARALKTVLDGALQDLMFDAPSLPPQKIVVKVVDKEFLIEQTNK